MRGCEEPLSSEVSENDILFETMSQAAAPINGDAEIALIVFDPARQKSSQVWIDRFPALEEWFPELEWMRKMSETKIRMRITKSM